MRDDNRSMTAAQHRIIRLVFGVLALASLLAGFVIWSFGPALGIDDDTARLVAIVLLAAGIGDVAVLHFWDRLFKAKG
jgi:hypothetical protein